MALDRSDISFASKEASRGMAKPTKGDAIRLKRILRYSKGAPKAVNKFAWQAQQEGIRVYTDSDWAGCRKTRKSTSGGFVMLGSHLIIHWASTQANVALSSAEAELNAIVKACSEALGLRNMYSAMRRSLNINILTDSSAANGIVHRTGCGKVKHLAAKQLWVQEHVESKVIKVSKVGRESNPSDVLTHHWSAVDGYRHLSNVGLAWC